MKSVFQKLEKWLGKPGNTKAKLAVILDYENTDAISQWVRRGRIPKYLEIRVLGAVNDHHAKK